MQRCIELAQLGAGAVSLNPMVGAVIVHGGKIIGEGYHQKYGGPHAEVEAINAVLNSLTDAAAILKESTIYVSLEPCAHFGKTPPCVDLIIRHEIPNVVIGCPDPFDPVNGKGIQKLKAAGINVRENILREECEFINRRFLLRVREQRPYIILKWAQTEDGYFAPADGSRRWISSKAARRLTHKWRTEEDAILVGKNTAAADNPELTAREWSGRNPKRIVLDRRLELSPLLHLFDQSVETIVFNQVKTETLPNLKFLELEDFDHYLPQLIAFQLYLMDIQSVIIEGGASTLDLFIQAGLWDEARVFRSGASWGRGIKAPALSGLLTEKISVGEDILTVYQNKK